MAVAAKSVGRSKGGLDPVALAQELIRRRSVTPADDGALDTLQRPLEALGFTCHRLTFSTPGHADIDNLYARLGTTAPNFCFAGHTDVVPPGDEARWSHPPFEAAIDTDDGLLYGRGAVDMKGALAAMVAGIDRFLGAGSTFRGSISLLITGDEEAAAVNGTTRVLDWLAEQGQTLDACVVGEPTNPEALGDMVKIGRRGSLTGRLTVKGVQGHTAYPQRADNAANRLVGMLAALTEMPPDEALDRGPNAAFDPSNLEITTIDIGNPAANVIPGEARATFNLRFNDHHDGAGLERWIRRKLDRVGGRYTLDVTVGAEPFLTPPGPFTDRIAGAVQRVTGRPPTLSTTGGTSDARFIRRACPVVEFGLVNRTIHQVDEHTPIADIERLADIYAAMLTDSFQDHASGPA